MDTVDGRGRVHPRLHRIWHAINARCHNPHTINYADYGGKGVRVQWQSWSDFRDWARTHGYQDDLVIDRVDPSQDYCAPNCRWVTRDVSNQNRAFCVQVTAFGETKVRAQWAKDPRCMVPLGTLRTRLAAGWDAETALTACAKYQQRQKPIEPVAVSS